MRLIKYLKVLFIAISYKLHLDEIMATKFPHIRWHKSIKQYIVFCPYCKEYICGNGLCSNPFCPEEID